MAYIAARAGGILNRRPEVFPFALTPTAIACDLYVSLEHELIRVFIPKPQGSKTIYERAFPGNCPQPSAYALLISAATLPRFVVLVLNLAAAARFHGG